MNDIYKASYYLLSLFLLVACAPTSLDEQELKDYILNEEHGVKKRMLTRDGFIEMMYKPNDLIIAQNYKYEINNRSTFDSLQKAFSPYLYFTLRISRQNKEIEQSFLHDQALYEEIIKYLSYGMEKDINLTTERNKTIIPVTDYNYAGMFGTTEATSIIIAFEKKSIEASGSFSIQVDGTKLGIGTYSFDFNSSDIQKTPKINIHTFSKTI